MHAINKQKGFIAIVSSLIIAAMLMLILFTLNFNQFMARFNILDSEYKEQSLALAEMCIENGILHLAQDPTFSGGVTLGSGSDTCDLLTISTSGSNTILRSTASINSSFSNIRVEVDPNLAVVTWNEVASH